MLKTLNRTKLFKTMVGDAKFIEVIMKHIFNLNTLKLGTYDTLSKIKVSFIKGIDNNNQLVIAFQM